jgi:hypothetical protein
MLLRSFALPLMVDEFAFASLLLQALIPDELQTRNERVSQNIRPKAVPFYSLDGAPTPYPSRCHDKLELPQLHQPFGKKTVRAYNLQPLDYLTPYRKATANNRRDFLTARNSIMTHFQSF